MFASLLPRLGCFVLLLPLSACNNFGPAPDQAEADAVKEESAVPVVEANGHTQSPLAGLSLEDDINRLLEAADSALQMDQLTTPIEDNAFDRYQAVLLLRRGHPRALAGLEQIFERYMTMAQAALRQGDVGRARAMMERARLVKNEHPALNALEADIAERQRQRPPQPTTREPANENEIILDPRALSRKDESMQQQLKALALKISQTHESLLIIARSDAEARWIYQTINETVPEYRVRGDVRLAREPKIVLLPPID